MARIYRATLALAVLALGAQALLAQDRKEIEAAAKVARESGETFLSSLEDVDEEQWNALVGDARHTIGEEAEHVAFAEQELQRLIKKALESPQDSEKAKGLAGKEETLRELMLEPALTGEHYKARRKLINKEEVLEYFNRAHRQLLNLLTNTPDLGLHVAKHPSKKYGDLTALQWFYYISYHKLRHCRQIEAIKADPVYPSRTLKASR